VYGAYPPTEGGTTEDHPMTPVNPYGASKASGELMVEAYRQTYGMKTASLRFANVYGPGKEGNVMEIFTKRALDGKPLQVTGGAAQTRNFTYVDDAVQGAYLAMVKDSAGAYNITGGKRVSILEIAKIVRKHIPGTVIEEAPARAGDAKVQGWLSIEKAGRELGYEPKVTIEEGLRRYIEWYREEFCRKES